MKLLPWVLINSGNLMISINLEPIIFIVATLSCLSVISGKVKNIPYPIFLVLAGLIIGFIPGLPKVKLDPDVILLIFLPPILYRAAWNTSWRDFKASIRPISRLAIGLVFCTIVVVAIVAHYFIPGMSWPVAFILGAIISPPDAVSATSIVRDMGLNKRIVTVLEGESLVNDASALVAYRYAVLAVVSTGFVIWKACLQFLWISIGGLGIGFLMGYIFCFVLKRIHRNPTVESVLSLLMPFIVYPVAERFDLSGVLAVVAAGLVTSWRSSEVFSYQGRTQSNAIWDMMGFLLNGVIFILIGLQLSGLTGTLKSFELSKIIQYGLIISGATILVRLLFIAPAAFFPKLLGSEIHIREETFNWKNALILSWSGMRGVVSLATAMALPVVMEDGNPFPQREVILIITFIVILVTLLGQVLSLPLLIRLLRVKPSNSEVDEERRLRLLVNNSALTYINDKIGGENFDIQAVEQVRELYELRVRWLKGKDLDPSPAGSPTLPELDNFLAQVINVQLAVTDFKRMLLIKLYRESSYSAQNIRTLEKEIDLDESRLRSQLQE